MGACSLNKIFNFRRSEIDSGALLGKKKVIFAWLRQRALLLLLEVSVHKHGNNRKHGCN